MPNPHIQINKDFEALGRQLGRLLRQSFRLEDASWVDMAETMLRPFEAYETGYDFAKLDGVLNRAWLSGKPTSHEAFNDAYRATFSYTDEFVSTASVRHLLIGMAEEIHAAASDLSLSPGELQLLRNIASRLFHGLSRIRFPTRYMGNNFVDGSAFGLHPVAPQHQHAMGTAVRGNGAAAFHSSFDLRRRIHVLNAMKTMLAANPRSVSAIFHTAVCEAIRHSTRRMSASLQAMNQIVTLDLATKRLMDWWRQTLKDFAAAGGIPVTRRIPARGRDPTRDYELGASQDSLSYERREEDSDAEDDALLSSEDDALLSSEDDALLSSEEDSLLSDEDGAFLSDAEFSDLGDLDDLLGDSDQVWDEDPLEEADSGDPMEVDDELDDMLAEAEQPAFASASQAIPSAWRNIDFMNDGRAGQYAEELDSSGMRFFDENGEATDDWPITYDLPALGIEQEAASSSSTSLPASELDAEAMLA